MKKLLLIVMLVLGAVTITGRPVQTYAYTEQQKQQAKSWLSSHGYAPTRAGAEQAYQDYMDGKIDVPEADAYLGKNKQKKVEKKKNSTANANMTNKRSETQSKNGNDSTQSQNTSTETKADKTTKAAKETTTAKAKATTETKKQQEQKAEKKKQEQKQEKKKHTTGIGIVVVAAAIFVILVVIMRRRM